MRVAIGAALGLALALGVLFGGAHLLAGRSTTARAIAWMESDIGDRHRFPSRAIRRASPVRLSVSESRSAHAGLAAS